MSHANIINSHPVTPLPANPGQIREPKGEYTANPRPLTDHTATVNQNLLRAEALAWVLNEPLDPDTPTAETLALIAQLIREAREAHNAQWDRLTENAAHT